VAGRQPAARLHHGRSGVRAVAPSPHDAMTGYHHREHSGYANHATTQAPRTADLARIRVRDHDFHVVRVPLEKIGLDRRDQGTLPAGGPSPRGTGTCRELMATLLLGGMHQCRAAPHFTHDLPRAHGIYHKRCTISHAP
jgi:hypothetical protein